jgi:sulfatase modifying factor 1
MSWRRLGLKSELGPASIAAATIAAVGLLTECASDRPTVPVLDCIGDAVSGCVVTDGGCSCLGLQTDLPPIAVIQFQTQIPHGDSDYPYGPGALSPVPPAPRSTVYLSADGSSDPEGTPFGVFWNVQDPTGAYLPVDPSTDARHVSFSPSRVGAYKVTLEATELGGLHQIGQTTLALAVGPHPCADDGVSPPCSSGLPVPGGQFEMGSPEGVGFGDEQPLHIVTLKPFILDQYEVTVGRFRRFVAAYNGPPVNGSGAQPAIPNSGWQSDAWANGLPLSHDYFAFTIGSCGGSWTDSPSSADALPMTCVNWFAAFAFCIWDGQRLPTEEEWEYAAKGGSDQRTYPWGEDPPSIDRAVYGCLYDGDPACTQTDLPFGGSAPLGVGRWGHLDLAGSVWEWVLDVYGPYTTDPCDGCANLTNGMGRGFRGGTYLFGDPLSLRAASRYGFGEYAPDQTRGFRCARSAVDAGSTTDGGSETDAPMYAASPMDAGGSGDGSPCTNDCALGLTQCASPGVQTCELQATGCTQWVATQTCGPQQSCSSTAGVASCHCDSTVCTEAGTVCQNRSTLATCVTDADGCLYVASAVTCTPESCAGLSPTAACSVVCGNTCAQGQTACGPGGLETCTLGADGCWGYGPAVACGNVQSCTGRAGSAACTCDVDPGCSAAGTACLPTSSTQIQSCSVGANGCTVATESACGSGLVCERYGSPACVDPNWAEWPMVDSPSYTDNGDGTVTDNGTGLVWQQSAPTTPFTQAAALAYCAGLNLNGYTDWRLPWVVELVSIVDPSTYNSSINNTVFPNTRSSFFWSSTPAAGASNVAWSVIFRLGSISQAGMSESGYARCVR